MAERPTRILAVLPLAATLAGCAATHVGDDWQCPLAQGEVCTSIVAADPAVAPDATPPPLATRTPFYRAAASDAAPEAQPDTNAQPDATPRPCAKGCHPLAWLGRLFAPRGTIADTAERDEVVSATLPEETPAPAGSEQARDVPCGAEVPMSEATAVANADAGATPCAIAAEARETTPPAPIMTAAPITPSTAATIPCGTDDVPIESPLEADGAPDGPASDDPETPCADPAPVDETAAAVIGEDGVSMVVHAEPDGVEGTTAEDTMPADTSPPAAATFVSPLPAPDALRTGEVVGRIWIAPFVDAGGVYREGAWVRAVLAPAAWRGR